MDHFVTRHAIRTDDGQEDDDNGLVVEEGVVNLVEDITEITNQSSSTVCQSFYTIDVVAI